MKQMEETEATEGKGNYKRTLFRDIKSETRIMRPVSPKNEAIAGMDLST